MAIISVPGYGQASSVFGRKLREAREAAGLSRAELGELLGVSTPSEPGKTVRRWEAGLAGVRSAEIRDKLLELFGPVETWGQQPVKPTEQRVERQMGAVRQTVAKLPSPLEKKLPPPPELDFSAADVNRWILALWDRYHRLVREHEALRKQVAEHGSDQIEGWKSKAAKWDRLQADLKGES